ncbi:MAG: protein kinase family protein [Kiritimatiellae bacterium]|nr:protein kinase family protein [Kiritimatiellia bacterium]
MKNSEAQREIIQFIRRRDYAFVKELGQGACGRTVLLHDEQIDEHFVCKKFAPCSEDDRQELFASFVRETKILHQVYHENVVRVFNYYLYPDNFTGFILMEFVDGTNIGDYLTQHPEMINEVFLQTISGFHYLQENKILHRDIRPANIMVRGDGVVKIIDFGFGKQIQDSKDFDKSVSLNWWCELPIEFSSQVYDFRTEVYFVGKLFERFIQENHIDNFKYTTMLGKMCELDPTVRIQRFADVTKAIQSDMFFEIDFGDEEMACYRSFADCVDQHITKIENKTEYVDDVERLQAALENAYRKFMLEETVPDSAVVTRCVVSGSYHYRQKGFPVKVVRDFLHMLKSSAPEKKRIILSNLHTRLDAISRYDEAATDDSDSLPF